jgi:hypothetical protein
MRLPAAFISRPHACWRCRFHQKLAISKLDGCNRSWHGSIAGEVFDILILAQKWLWIMRSVRCEVPIELEEAGDLSLAMQRGVAE